MKNKYQPNVSNRTIDGFIKSISKYHNVEILPNHFGNENLKRYTAFSKPILLTIIEFKVTTTQCAEAITTLEIVFMESNVQ
jgi:hypothetical protein